MSDKYTLDSTLAEILGEPAALDVINKLAPGMVDSPAFAFMKVATLNQMIANAPAKAGMLNMLLDAANGKEVEVTAVDSTKELPKIEWNDDEKYDIDDIDGKLYMIEHRFGGCLVVRFSKTMDESVYGKITCNGAELPQGLIAHIQAAGGIQMFGIPVKAVFTEYDTEYTLCVEGFKDTDGNTMNPQELKVRTLPKVTLDPAYAEHDEVALQAAREGIVLLKNENNLLPLAPTSTLFVDGINDFRLGAVGAGKINPRYSIRLNRAIDEYSEFTLSKNADIGVIVISRPSGENYDNNVVKGEFYLSDDEEDRICELCRKYEKTVAVINSGYPMDVRWAEKYNVKAVLWCGFAGMLGGRALVEILDGRVNPSGKLPDTWSFDYYDIPASRNFFLPKDSYSALPADSPLFIDTVYEEDIYIGYRYFETFGVPVAYPFGFGLSYTSFYINAALVDSVVFGTITNTGDHAGKEIIQVYAKIPDGKLEQPNLRLVGFIKTPSLQSGEKYKFNVEIDKKTLASFDTELAAWVIERGFYEFFIGNAVNKTVVFGEMTLDQDEIIKQSENLMRPPIEIECLSKNNPAMPTGKYSKLKGNAGKLEHITERKHYSAKKSHNELVSKLSLEELARLSVCASHGWGMHEKGEAGKIYRLPNRDIPQFVVADGNNGVNVNKPNIGMPCSNTVCATWNAELAYNVGRVIAEEAKENGIDMILAPAMNIHRNPLNGRHPEYFSEDLYLAGIMAGNHGKGLQDSGVSSCIKHVVANNCEASRKRNHSIMSERALREIYLKVFEVAMSVYKPDSLMTGYNACNGCYTAEDEELLVGIFRNEFGFDGFVMTDWNSYDSIDIVKAASAGNCWFTPGSTDNTYVKPIIDGVNDGRIDIERLRENVGHLLNVVQEGEKIND
jgi:beta-glucosidase